MRVIASKELTNMEEILENLWDGGLKTAKGIVNNGEKKELEAFIEERFQDGEDIGKLNDLIWFTEDQTWVNYGVSYYLKMNFYKNKALSFDEMVEGLKNNCVYAEYFEEEEEEEEEEEGVKTQDFDLLSIENDQYVCTCEITYDAETKKYSLEF